MTNPLSCGCGEPHDTGDPDATIAAEASAPRRLRATRRQLLGGGFVVAAGALAAGAVPLADDVKRLAGGGLGLAGARSIAVRRAFPGPHVVRRAEWGADERRRGGPILFDSHVRKLVVHHTVTPTNPADPAAWVRQIYGYELARGYVDISYHWLIDQHGTIYEGRWARAYPRGAVVDGENAHHQNVQGAATFGHNPATIAIAMIGDFRAQLPTVAALDALVTVLAWKCARWDLAPTGHGPYRAAAGGAHDLPTIAAHSQCSATLCPGATLLGALPSLRARVVERVASGGHGGYIAVSATGHVTAHGDAPRPSTSRRPSNVAAAAYHPHGHGYWLAGSNGGVFAYGDARFYGSAFGLGLRAPITAMAGTRAGHGYWLVSADGGVFAYGDARFYGSAAPVGVHAPIVAVTVTTSGHGYWLAAADGGIFCFGDAHFHGAASAHALSAPITAMARTPSGNGYWLIAADGGVFCFGDARYHGSGHGRARSRVVAIVPTPKGDGYVLGQANGAVLRFGAAVPHARAHAHTPVPRTTPTAPAHPVVAVVGRLGVH